MRNLGTPPRRDAGFTILEVTVGLVCAVAGLLAVSEMIVRSQDAAAADYAKSKSIRKADDMLRLLTGEIAQTTTSVDESLPTAEQQRMWLLSDGLTFQKVAGHDLTAMDDATTRWSAPITYRFDAARRAVLRRVASGPERVLADGISAFEARVTPTGQVVVVVEVETGAVNRGTAVTTRRVARVTPRNRLQ